MRLLTLSLVLLFSGYVMGQRTSICLQPVQLQQVGDTVAIKIWTESPLPGQDIYIRATNTNTSSNVTKNILFNPYSGYYEVRFPLTGFPDDTVLLRIAGSHATPYNIAVIHNASLIITPDALPQIMLDEPVSNAVADPDLRLKAKVTDNTDSARLIYTLYRSSGDYMDSDIGWDSIDAQLDLSACYGQYVYLLVQALDNNHQANALDPIRLYVESSP
jgi:hypothetical protein